MKRVITKIFIDEIYNKPPIRYYPTNKTIYKHSDEIWSIDSADVIDYKNSIKKRFRYIFIINDNFSNFSDVYHLKIKLLKQKKMIFQKSSTTSKRSPHKIESDRGKECYNLQNLFKN